MPEEVQWLTGILALFALFVAIKSWGAANRQADATEEAVVEAKRSADAAENAVRESARSADAAESADHKTRAPRFTCEVGEPELGNPFTLHVRVHTRLDELTFHFILGQEPERRPFWGFAHRGGLDGVVVPQRETAEAKDILGRSEVPAGTTCTLRIEPIDYKRIPPIGRAVMLCKCRRGREEWEVVLDTGDVSLRPGSRPALGQ